MMARENWRIQIVTGKWIILSFSFRRDSSIGRNRMCNLKRECGENGKTETNNTYLYVLYLCHCRRLINYFLGFTSFYFGNNYSIQLRTMSVSTAQQRTTRVHHERYDFGNANSTVHSTQHSRDFTTVCLFFSRSDAPLSQHPI